MSTEKQSAADVLQRLVVEQQTTNKLLRTVTRQLRSVEICTTIVTVIVVVVMLRMFWPL
jgi:hypothetical protein